MSALVMMPSLPDRFVVLLSVLAIMAFSACEDQKLTPIGSERLDDSENLHGHLLKNPYSWLEELDSAAVLTWVKSQDDFTRQSLHRAYAQSQTIRDRMRVYVAQPAFNTPVRRGDAFFYMVDSERHPSPALYMIAGDKEKVLAAPGDFAEVGLDGPEIADFRISPSGRYAALIGLSASSGRRVMRILNVDTMTYLPGVVEDARLANDVWSANEEEIYYSTGSGVREAGVWKHALDDRTASDLLLYSGKREDRRFSVDAHSSSNKLVIVERASNSRYLVWLIEVGEGDLMPLLLISSKGGRVEHLGSVGNETFFYSVDSQRVETVIAVDWSDAADIRARKVIELGGLSVASAHLAGGRILINGLNDDAPSIFVFDAVGDRLAMLKPPFGLLWTNYPVGRPPVFADPDGRYAYVNSVALDAPGVYEVDTQELKLSAWRLHDFTESADVEVNRVRYESADGASIPMSLVHKEGLSKGQAAPTLVWVYGAHGFMATPFFNGFFRAFIDSGGILAMPQVRGGGYDGARWHAAGSRANKRNTIEDTIAALEWLIQSGVTRSDRMSIIGNSAGTIPVAIAGIRRPDLVRCMILENPLSDLIRHANWSGGWATEFGDPSIVEEFEAILEFSPYEILNEPRDLPATLILAGENDTVAPPHHAYKLAAAMQHAQSGPYNIYLYIVRGAGHQIGTNKTQRFESQSYELAFLQEMLGMEE